MNHRHKNDLGIGAAITRRDFLNGAAFTALAGTLPSGLLGIAHAFEDADAWYGYGGVGDYSVSHGNTPEVVSTAHRLRDGQLVPNATNVIETGELYDLIVVGGGIAGLAAARRFLAGAPKTARCLILENHPLAGGEAKRNDFLVDGVKLTGPQGSNASVVPNDNGWYGTLWDELGLPRQFEYEPARGDAKGLRIARDSYLYSMLNADELVDTGFFFSKPHLTESRWVINPAADSYESLPLDPAVRRALWQLKTGVGPTPLPAGGDRWLDGISLSHYLEGTLGMPPAVTEIYSQLMALNCGVGSDAVSALVAKKLFVRFFEGFDDCCVPADFDPAKDYRLIPFPGGNDAVARHFLKAIRPEVIAGGSSFNAICTGTLDLGAFDAPGVRARIRTRSTAVEIRHEGDAQRASRVAVTYCRGGQLYRARGAAVVSAVGSWVNRRILPDLDDEHRWAFSKTQHGSNLVVNVALKNWRPLAKLGITACHYFTDRDLGIYCNIREPMRIGGRVAPLDPDQPIVLTFYIGFPSRGTAREQAVRARLKLFNTSFASFELQIRELLTDMLGHHGFDARRDVAGIVLNRWGHSYVVPEPGFFFGLDGRPPISTVMSRPHGRVAFAHSEMAGIQTWEDAARYGEQAANHLLATVS